MTQTNIEYLDYTWNVTHGCSAVSEGCQHCWAKAMSKRLAAMGVCGYSKDDPFAVTCCDWKLNEPLKVKRASRIGVSFMGDLFHEDVPFRFICRVWDVMKHCRRHTFILLTKRPKRMADLLRQQIIDLGHRGILPNLWLGVTVESPDQLSRLDVLEQIPAVVKFVSIEPMLAGIELGRHLKWLDWVIVGGESGAGRRYCDHNWIRRVVEDCGAARVSVFVKQIHNKDGRVIKNFADHFFPPELRVREYPQAGAGVNG